MTVKERITAARVIEKAQIQKGFSERLEISYRYIAKPVGQNLFGKKESKLKKI